MRVVFANGTSFWMQYPPRLEFLLDPLVLKFATLSTFLYILSTHRPESLVDEFWIDASLWASTLLFALISFGLVLSAVRFLVARGVISFVYTPLIIAPMVVLNVALTQVVFTLVTGDPITSVPAIIPNLMRDFCSLVIFDILFGTFVAPMHPSFSQGNSAGIDHARAQNLQSAPKTAINQIRLEAPIMDLSHQSAGADVAHGRAIAESSQSGSGSALYKVIAGTAEPSPGFDEVNSGGKDNSVVRVNGEAVCRDDIVSVRAQDHYVRVYTLQNVYVLRANFTEFLEELGDEAGVQVSRSVWVSFEHVSLVWRTDALRYRVVLVGGEEIQVTNSRNIRVVDAMRQKGIPVVQSQGSSQTSAANETDANPVQTHYGKAS